jgi:dienelactone hydrolase
MPRKYVYLAAAILLVLICIPGRGLDLSQPTAPLARGAVIPKVVCLAEPEQSYALYLPSKYSAGEKWPILYAFDPGARGKVPVELFAEAAEKFGYIVAGSNNSRNGPMNPILAAANAMFRDTQHRFALDEHRFYATGFSGGGGVAISLGCGSNGLIAGVIVCSCPFPEELRNLKSIPFTLYGTAGVEDFNFPALRQLDRFLNERNVPNRMVVFQGGHEWLPKALTFEALEWMELQAMRSGTRTQNPAFIDQVCQAYLGKVQTHERSGELYEAYLDYRSMVSTFQGLRDTQEWTRKSAELRETKAVKESLKKEGDLIRHQQGLMQEFGSQLVQLRDPDAKGDAMASLKRTITLERMAAASNKPSDERIVAKRFLLEAFIALYSTTTELLERKEYGLVIPQLTLQTLIKPESSTPWYRLACAYAMTGDRKRSLSALKTATEKGFMDLEALKSDPEMSGLRAHPEFQTILGEMEKRRPLSNQ